MREFGGVLDLDRGKKTVAEFMERWWRDYALVQLQAKTRGSYGRVRENHLRRRLGATGPAT